MQKKEIFSDRLCFLRKKCGLRSFDFAKKLGLSQSQVSRYENGINSPDIDMLAKIAEVLDANLHWLITGKPSPDAEKAIRILKPFAQARLSQITSDMQKLIDEIADLRAKGAVAMVFLTLKNKDTGEPVEITSCEVAKVPGTQLRVASTCTSRALSLGLGL